MKFAIGKIFFNNQKHSRIINRSNMHSLKSSLNVISMRNYLKLILNMTKPMRIGLQALSFQSINFIVDGENMIQVIMQEKIHR